MAESSSWADLCLNVSPILHVGLQEDAFHKFIEAQLRTVFGWTDNEVAREVPVQMGSTTKRADLVLSANGAKIVVEMKKPGVALGEREAAQLASYMRIQRAKYGLLIGDRIKVLYDDDSTDEDPIQVADIRFSASDKDGVELGQVLAKESFSEPKLKTYCVDRIRRRETKQKMANLKQRLLADEGRWIKEIVEQKLQEAGYKDISIKELLKDIEIRQVTPRINAEDSSRRHPHVLLGEAAILQSPTTMPEKKPRPNYYINGSEVSELKMEHFLSEHQPLNVRVGIQYASGKTAKKIWKVRNFTRATSLVANVNSGFLRRWQEKGIVSIRFDAPSASN
jgi:hypothetical protein